MTQWKSKEIGALAEAVDFSKGELVAAVARDHESGRVLMIGYQNREAFEKTLETGEMHYFSRSKGRLWKKGEQSGHVQRLTSVFLDCDGDALLYEVEQVGPGACHTGHYSCFFRKAGRETWEPVGGRIFQPEDVYR